MIATTILHWTERERFEESFRRSGPLRHNLAHVHRRRGSSRRGHPPADWLGGTITDRRLEEALRHLHPPPVTKLWYGGASVLGALRGLSPEVAAWRPYPDRHSIWALALHVAYWNYAVRRRITGEERGGFPRGPSNFPGVPPQTTKAAWKEDRRLVKAQHELLVEALTDFDPSRLDEFAGSETQTTYADLITGIVLHDTYHAGQIVMLKRLAASRGL